MTEQQSEFLRLCIMEQLKLAEISKTLNLEYSLLSRWYNIDLRLERTLMAQIRKLWLSKNLNSEISFTEFQDWYKSAVKKCHYCGITEAEISELNSTVKLTKRFRGKKLEFDRIVPNDKYSLSNIVLACYWCNNAKTDTFSHDEFLEIGKAIAYIWKKRLEINQ